MEVARRILRRRSPSTTCAVISARRPSRAAACAREGRVLARTLDAAGRLDALVQGGRAAPYALTARLLVDRLDQVIPPVFTNSKTCSANRLGDHTPIHTGAASLTG